MANAIQYHGSLMASIHETAEGLNADGLMSKQTLREFDELCLTPVQTLAPEEIRALRLREGASQAVFARYLNVTTGLVSQWERGERRPQGASLKLLSLVAQKGLSNVASDRHASSTERLSFQGTRMAQFVHLADAKMAHRIAKVGILAHETRLSGTKGFFCTPVSLDFYRTHQWLRELKRRGVRTFQAIQFKLAPNTQVWVGRYNVEHVKVTAAEAAKIFHEHTDGLGLEVIVPKSLPNTSITRIYTPPQVAGWRFQPEAKGKKPFCGCRYCNRGAINAYRVITEPREDFKSAASASFALKIRDLSLVSGLIDPSRPQPSY